MKDFFHSNLVRARENAGLTQEQLAESLGVSRTVIVSLEGGRTNLFSKHIPGIARILGMTEEELLCGVPADTLLLDELTRSERERALIEDYERRLALLQEKLEAANRLNEVLQGNVESLTRSNQYLVDQLRREQ